MLSWIADQELSELLQRYYRGEAGLWEAIRERVDHNLRERGATVVARHLRFRKKADGSYEVLVEDAPAYAVDP
ncbi:MAG: hypothetical protein GFH27_549331n54 [Chloroflexi bacterium AL-W]|nr:hypothetical protein [Chloroflexi bacterium AL-N1]NOK70355.1 hypothetical protein [Chloroflexi bacterium AL-N10]NOK78033.1 hypothetical protein [Chloroflexi bacterium AL-N5]NOK85132.1 hypothetical protein [Chloroflexi bacterium AL-W]NOK92121.1 hypothetical protein [Chloroflexi bacterium AL-N15]